MGSVTMPFHKKMHAENGEKYAHTHHHQYADSETLLQTMKMMKHEKEKQK